MAEQSEISGAAPGPDESCASAERIGVLLVHGIGEQGRFEHLMGEVRCLAAALRSLNRGATVEITQGTSAALMGSRETLCADGKPPVQVTMKRADGRLLTIAFHEVWWADLGEPYSLRAALRFWLWGLSMWTLNNPGTSPPGASQMVWPPTGTHGTIVWSDRARLFYVGVLFLLGGFTVGALDFLGRRIGLGSIPVFRQVVNYLGDVKLYTDARRWDGDVLPDIGQPPRVGVRRRMVNALAEMALAKYDRWYVWGHSLGSVVAFNGLMETAHALPNYLNREQWVALRKAGLAGSGVSGVDWPAGIGVPPTAEMMPPRPPWLKEDDVVHRHRLFERLYGFATYGSPLDKFATLWPRIVPLNTLGAVFPKGFEWVNVYDPTDPVGANLDFFDFAKGGADRPVPGLGNRIAPEVSNAAYKAHPILLYSHIQYLKASGGDCASLLLRWVLGDWSTAQNPGDPPGDRWRWMQTSEEIGPRRALARFQAFLLAPLLLILAGGLIFGVLPAALDDWLSPCAQACAPADAEPPCFLEWFWEHFQVGLWRSLYALVAGLVGTFVIGLLMNGWPKPADWSQKPKEPGQSDHPRPD